MFSHRSVLILGFLDIIIIATVVSSFVYLKQPGFALIILLVSAVIIPVLLYDVNCTYVGNCRIWGVIKTALLIIQALLTIIFMILGFASGNTAQQKVQNIIQPNIQVPTIAIPSQ